MSTTPYRRDPVKFKAQVRAANRARYRAVRLLIRAHEDEFMALYEQQALLEGVTARGPRVTQREQIEAKIAELTDELARIERRRAGD